MGLLCTKSRVSKVKMLLRLRKDLRRRSRQQINLLNCNAMHVRCPDAGHYVTKDGIPLSNAQKKKR
jgi:hypothetical protein